ncbi:hypothetical protein [Pseudoflavitalea rhizosphaerae]|uniref:hypothetical protein n=1 Tax=Pseudoflavitalea rhizosphaerae TaxID=1884793 RepID=UPI000F8E73A4|nr:hypothetical protein [Pseudoflavitalea rhizosphaerae]
MRTLSLAIVLMMACLFTHNKIEAGDIAFEQKQQALVNYTWYYDWDYTIPVGSVRSLADELARLRLAHPGYNFSSTGGGGGMLEYEWGYFNPLVTTVIYSNMY